MSKGCPNKYKTIIQPNLQVILGWLRSGYTEETIAKRLGLGHSTWHRHKTAQPEFAKMVNEGRQDTGALAVNSLFRRVLGYEYEETTVEERLVEGKKQTFTKTITKQMAPDVAACCFFIVNRLPELWQHIQHIQHSGEVFNTLSDADCENIRKLLRGNLEQNTSQ